MNTKRALLRLPILLFIIGQFILSPVIAGENSETMKLVRKQALITGKPGRTITYGKESKGEIWIFTDVGCPACVKLHQDIATLNDLKVKVHVMAFPRQGLNSTGYTKMVSIWCSKNPAEALDKAMHGESIGMETCENPIQTQYNLGQSFGITGTPTIVFSDGTQWAGYFVPERLAQEAVARQK